MQSYRCRYDGKECESASLYGEMLDPAKLALIDRLCRRCWRAPKAHSDHPKPGRALNAAFDGTRLPGAKQAEDSH